MRFTTISTLAIAAGMMAATPAGAATLLIRGTGEGPGSCTAPQTFATCGDRIVFAFSILIDTATGFVKPDLAMSTTDFSYEAGTLRVSGSDSAGPSFGARSFSAVFSGLWPRSLDELRYWEPGHNDGIDSAFSFNEWGRGGTLRGRGDLHLDIRTVAPGAGMLNVATFGAAGVPEPASWATMIAGFALVGGAVRRRRVAPAAA